LTGRRLYAILRNTFGVRHPLQGSGDLLSVATVYCGWPANFFVLGNTATKDQTAFLDSSRAFCFTGVVFALTFEKKVKKFVDDGRCG